jgi:hypothetical protein
MKKLFLIVCAMMVAACDNKQPQPQIIYVTTPAPPAAPAPTKVATKTIFTQAMLQKVGVDFLANCVGEDNSKGQWEFCTCGAERLIENIIASKPTYVEDVTANVDAVKPTQAQFQRCLNQAKKVTSL